MASKRERRERARLKRLEQEGAAAHPTEEHKEAHAEGHGRHDHAHTHDHKGHRKEGPIDRFISLSKHIYEKEYKKLFIITILLFVLAVAQIIGQIAMTGDFINKGVSLKGGVTIAIPHSDYDPDKLESYLRSSFPKNDINIRTLTGLSGEKSLAIDADITDQNEIKRFEAEIAKELNLKNNEYSANFVGSSLGSNFFRQTIIALIIAFIGMSLVVLIYFWSPAPSIIVILCAACDIIETLATVNLLGIKVSTGGIAAFLMLIGYSVDTDILLTTRMLKRKEETMEENIYSSAKTGLTMTITAIAAVLVALLLSQSAELKQIMTILLIGLFYDILNTWIQNMGVLRWYIEYRHAKKSAQEGQ